MIKSYGFISLSLIAIVVIGALAMLVGWLGDLQYPIFFIRWVAVVMFACALLLTLMGLAASKGKPASATTKLDIDFIWKWRRQTSENYLVIPQSAIDQMPEQWRDNLNVLTKDLYEYFYSAPKYQYQVTAKDPVTGKFTADPLAQHVVSPKPRPQQYG
jgi:hypothetical protein